ncbi:MAG: hypothetical protein M3P08_20685 [Thermoproteota archaeon]|nr:hypothetical protein [Thermoproteota archaeon]
MAVLKGFSLQEMYVFVVVDFFLFSCDNVVVMTQENVFVDENFFVLHIQYLHTGWDIVSMEHIKRLNSN